MGRFTPTDQLLQFGSNEGLEQEPHTGIRTGQAEQVRAQSRSFTMSFGAVTRRLSKLRDHAGSAVIKNVLCNNETYRDTVVPEIFVSAAID